MGRGREGVSVCAGKTGSKNDEKRQDAKTFSLGLFMYLIRLSFLKECVMFLGKQFLGVGAGV